MEWLNLIKITLKPIFKISKDVIEKPSTNNIPSNLRIVGRYIFPYTTMNYLEKLKPGKIMNYN